MNVIKYLLLSFALISSGVQAKGELLSVTDFISESFEHHQPVLKTLWLNNTQRATATEIMNRNIGALRVRYWKLDNRTAWVLEEIGKELPITIGVVVENNKINRVEILTYRESRGGEVRFPAFRKQFVNAKLNTKKQLDSRIDGITGATLSVRAVKRVASLALYYHQQVFSQ